MTKSHHVEKWTHLVWTTSPGFSSTRVFHTKIVQDIAGQYANHPEIITKFNLPKDHNPVDISLSRSKIHAEYIADGKNQNIDTDALMLYAPTAQAELAIIYLTRISSLKNPTTYST
jgi:hypothetical protein